MAISPTAEMTNDLKVEELQAHNYLQELRKPNELNDLILINVDRIVQKVSQQCDQMEVLNDIVVLAGLLRIRKSRKVEKRIGNYSPILG